MPDHNTRAALRKCRTCGDVYPEDGAHPCDGGSDPYAEALDVKGAMRMYGLSGRSVADLDDLRARLAGVERERDAAHEYVAKLTEAKALADLERLGDPPEDPIAALLAHLADQALRIPRGDAFRDGGLAGASRYNVAMWAIRQVLTWDHHRKGPVGADCSACGQLRACSPQGATGYPLCLPCYTTAVMEAAETDAERVARSGPPGEAPEAEAAPGAGPSARRCRR